MERSFKFDPRDLIMGPFVKCPKCGGTAFGILSVGPDRFKRRCRECWLTRDFVLPEVHKTIIYLDQFVITNLAHIHAKGEKRPRPFFYTLYEKLMHLSTIQAIVCPVSSAHRLESMVSKQREHLTDGFEMLAHDVRFADFDHIKYAQVFDRLEKWLKEDTSDACGVGREDVLEGTDPDVWHNRFRISVDMPPMSGQIDSLQSYLEKSHDGLVDVFENTWKKQPEQPWEYWRDREAAAWGQGEIPIFLREIQKFDDIQNGRREPANIYDLQPHDTVLLFNGIAYRIGEAGYSKEERMKRTFAFMRSNRLLKSAP